MSKSKVSAGLLLYRLVNDMPEVLLVHPGGPFFRNKDKGWWTVPKGELLPDEDALSAAKREFEEETGYKPTGAFRMLQPVIQKGGKLVHCWAVNGDFDSAEITSNTFALEWPPKSGKIVDFPEIDRAAWFSLKEAMGYINEQQQNLLTELGRLLARD
jgi:predicted NUDIX family NTP pyrophosphohydrolase